MVTKILSNLYQIQIELGDHALRSLNSYYIKGTDGGPSLLIDAGFKTGSCYNQFMEALSGLDYDKENCDFLCTHMHTDHTALSTALTGTGGRIYMHELDLDFARNRAPGTPAFRKLEEQMIEEGAPEHAVHSFCERRNIQNADFRDPRFTPFQDGAVFTYGGIRLEMIHVPGHTPGNCMIWLPEEKVMLTGDHILYDISPNIAVFPGSRDLLGQYLDSLRLADRFDPTATYPAHRETGDYHKRIAELLLHHEERLNECYNVIRNHPGINTYEIASQLTWNISVKKFEDFPEGQLFFAFTETMAHLEYLKVRNKIRKDGKGRYFTY